MSAQLGGQAHLISQIASEEAFKTNRAIRQIVCEEWQAAVKHYDLRPGNVTEQVVSKIINRIDELAVK